MKPKTRIITLSVALLIIGVLSTFLCLHLNQSDANVNQQITQEDKLTPPSTESIGLEEYHPQQQAQAEQSRALTISQPAPKTAELEAAERYYNDKHYKQAIPLLQSAAEGGNASAAALLSVCYECGLGIKYDKATAGKWAKYAQDGGINTASLPRPTPTAPQGGFDDSKPFAKMADVSRLDGVSGGNNTQGLNLYHTDKISAPVLYTRTFDTFHGLWLFINEDIIATSRDEYTIDFWDTRSQRYYFSCYGIRNPDSLDFWQYDSNTARLGYRSMRVYNSFHYAGGITCSAIDFCTLQTEFRELQLDDLYGTDSRNEVPKNSGKVFKDEKFRHLDKLAEDVGLGSEDSLYAHEGGMADLNSMPELKSLVTNIHPFFTPLRLEDLDTTSLTVKKQTKQKTDAENWFNEDFNVNQIKGFPRGNENEWLTVQALNGIYHIERDVSASDKSEGYLYDSIRKMLYPMLSESGFAGTIQGLANDCFIGKSDMEWYTTTVYCWSVRYHSEWMGDMVWDRKTNKVYDINNAQEDEYNFEEVRNYYNHNLAGVINVANYGGCHLLSVWNQLPGGNDHAYWIAAGDKGWTLCEVRPSAGECNVIAHGSATWKHGLSPIWLDDRKWLCIPLNDNAWHIHYFDIERMHLEELCYIYLHGENEYAVVLPNGHYAGSPGCEKFLSLQKNGITIEMKSLAPWRNRPAEILETLGGNKDDISVLQYTTKRWLSKLGYEMEAMPPEPTASDFPTIHVARPSLITFQPSVNVPIKVCASNSAVAHVEVRLDGSDIKQNWSDNLFISPGTETTLQAQLPLIAGNNWVEITPIDTAGIRGNTQKFRIIYKTQKQQSKMYVVAMGVSQYDDENLSLQYAAKDAHDIAAAFRKHNEGTTEILLLQDDDINHATVLGKVQSFLSTAKPEDCVVMYCAGHGMLDDKLEYYYAPSNFDCEKISETGIAMKTLLDTLGTTPARNRLLMLDTCHAGNLGEEGEEKIALAMDNISPGVRAIQHRGMKVKKAGLPHDYSWKKRYIEEFFALGTTRRGINVLAASAGAEFALESGEWQNGVFTASVIEALRGQDGVDANQDGLISVAELAKSVSDVVKKKTGGLQSPTISMQENDGVQTLIKTPKTK